MPIQRLPSRALSGAITTTNLPPQISIHSAASAGALTIDANSHITMPSQPIKTVQTFTSTGTSTWTKPTGCKYIKVYVTAGGGGGGAHNSDDAQGGGGAGGTAIKIIDVTSVSSVSVTVGAGGTAAAGNTSAGAGSGGASSFGAYCSASGGAGPSTWAVGGRGGVGSGGDLNLYGSDGICGNIDGGGNEESGGNGGESYWGGTGTGGSYWGARQDPRGWGCGGSGTHVTTNNAGTAGMSGAVVVEEYYI